MSRFGVKGIDVMDDVLACEQNLCIEAPVFSSYADKALEAAEQVVLEHLPCGYSRRVARAVDSLVLRGVTRDIAVLILAERVNVIALEIAKKHDSAVRLLRDVRDGTRRLPTLEDEVKA